MASHYIVGIDLGGTNMQIGVVSPTGEVIASARDKTRADDGFDAILDRLAKGTERACADAGIAVNELKAIGIGAPGAIEPHQGVVLEAVNLRWNNVPLRDKLQDRIGVPTVVDNDVNVAVFGEWRNGVGKGVDDLLGVWVGTGIGGGLILRGDLYQGACFTAGEIGHTTLFPGAALGTRSLEQNCSRTSVANRIISLIKSNRPSVLADRVNEDGKRLKSKLIGGAYMEGDELVCEVVNETAELLGTAIAGTVTLLSLPRVILGGGLTEAIGEPFVAKVRDAVHRYAFPERCRNVEVLASVLEDDAGVVGAAMLAQERLGISVDAQEATPYSG